MSAINWVKSPKMRISPATFYKNKAVNELTPKELQTPRTASQFLPWVKQRIEEVASTANGNHAIRYRKGLAKQLVEEALPLGIFASHHYGDSDEVTINLVLGNQNYDAVIEDNRKHKSPFSFIEVTQAHEGENSHLRMLVLDREDHVNVLGKVYKSGMKATRIDVEVENIAVNHSTVIELELQRIEAAIQRKIEKPYPHNTALLVVFDDHISIKDRSDHDLLHNYVEAILSQIKNFQWLALVGWSGRTFLEFNLSK